jgi:hypothetical protein
MVKEKKEGPAVKNRKKKPTDKKKRGVTMPPIPEKKKPKPSGDSSNK